MSHFKHFNILLWTCVDIRVEDCLSAPNCLTGSGISPLFSSQFISFRLAIAMSHLGADQSADQNHPNAVSSVAEYSMGQVSQYWKQLIEHD